MRLECEMSRNGYPCHAVASFEVEGDQACSNCKEDFVKSMPSAFVIDLRPKQRKENDNGKG